MIFNEVMALIMPSVAATMIYAKLVRKKWSFFEWIGNVALFMLITNTICYSILIYLNKTPDYEFSNVFTMKYSMLAMIIVLLEVIIYRFLEMNIRIKLKVENMDE